MVMVIGSQLRLLLGGAVVASFSGLAACLLRRRFSAPRILRRFDWPDQSLLTEDAPRNPHAEFHLFGRDSNFLAAMATPVQFGDFMYQALSSGQRLEFIIHDTRPTYAVWLFYRTLWAYSPTISTSRQLGPVLQPSMQFFAICYIMDVEQLLLSLISAYYTAGPGRNNSSLSNSASIQILDIRIPRSTFLLVQEPAAISYSMWTFIRSIWAMRPGSTHSRSTALIPVTLLNPFDFVVVCVERLMHALLANLREAAIQSASASNRMQLVSQSEPMFEPELASVVHYVIPLALARRFRLVPQGTTTISYSQWAFNLSIRARSPSQAPSSSALSVLLHSPMEFVWRCYGDWMITMLLIRTRAINQMAEIVSQDQPNNSAQFLELFMRAAAAANLPIRNSTAVIGLGSTSFAPHHLLDPALRVSILRESSIVADDYLTGEISRGGCVAPVSQTPSQDRRPLLPSLQPQPCLIRQGPGFITEENGIGTRRIILGLSGGSREGKAGSASHGDYAKGPHSAMGPHFVSGGFEVKPDGSMGCLNWGSTSDQPASHNEMGKNEEKENSEEEESDDKQEGIEQAVASGRTSGVTDHAYWIVPPHLLHRRLMRLHSTVYDHEKMRANNVAPTDAEWTAHTHVMQPLNHSEASSSIRPAEAAPQGPSSSRGLVAGREIAMSGLKKAMHGQPVPDPAGRWVPPPHLLHPPLGSSETKYGSSSKSEPRRDSLLLQPAGGHVVEQRPVVVASRAPTHARWTAPANLSHHPSSSRSYYNGVVAAGGTALGGSHRSRRSQAGSRRRAQDGVEQYTAHVEQRVLFGNNSKGKELMIDSVISDGRNVEIKERVLEKWAPDGNEDLSCLPSLEEPLHGPKSYKKWDQFEVNKTLFGVQSTYNEEIYMTKLIKGPRELEVRAARIAREIEREETEDLHLAEERGKEISSEMDEEERYSSVTRGGDM